MPLIGDKLNYFIELVNKDLNTAEEVVRWALDELCLYGDGPNNNLTGLEQDIIFILKLDMMDIMSHSDQLNECLKNRADEYTDSVLDYYTSCIILCYPGLYSDSIYCFEHFNDGSGEGLLFLVKSGVYYMDSKEGIPYLELNNSDFTINANRIILNIFDTVPGIKLNDYVTILPGRELIIWDFKQTSELIAVGELGAVEQECDWKNMRVNDLVSHLSIGPVTFSYPNFKARIYKHVDEIRVTILTDDIRLNINTEV